MVVAIPAAAIELTEVARFNLASTSNELNDEYIGSNPSAIAWNGSRLFVGGFNASGQIRDISIVEILNATDTGIIDMPSYSAPFGIQVAAPNISNYTGLDLSPDGESLAAAFDDTLAGTPDGYAVFDTGDYSTRWSKDERGTAGPAFDPGFEGNSEQGSGVYFPVISGGRRTLLDTETGDEIYGPEGIENGFVWWSFAGTTVNRDVDFDPDTGDIYVRHSNNVGKAERTGENSAEEGLRIFVDDSADPNVLGRNLSYISGTDDGDFIIFNSRNETALDQPFDDSVMVIDPEGNPEAATFDLLDGGSIADGNALYDFDFDPATQTLALMDFVNRNVHIFSVGPPDAGISGDYNGDGFVDAADYTVWRDTLGSTSDLRANGDDTGASQGVIDQADYLAWKTNYGEAPQAVTASVPEPGAMAICLVGVLAAACVGWQRRVQQARVLAPVRSQA